MHSGPTITPAKLIAALLNAGVVTNMSLIALLGEARHDVTLNVLEMALVRDNVIGNGQLLAIKGQAAGMPILEDATAAVTSRLDVRTATAAGALVVDCSPLTVAMVEDTPDNLELVRSALQTTEFAVCLVTTPQFVELRQAAYEGATVDRQPACRDLFEVLDEAVRRRASDVHLCVGKPPVLRVDGALTTLLRQPLDRMWLRAQVEMLAEARHMDDLDATFSTDFAYTYGTARFRINVAHDLNGPTMALRKLPTKIPSAEELHLPPAVRRFAHLERGLVLVTGPTGSGKSTTLAALLWEILNESGRHVITLEDPVEFRLPHRRSHVNQRELGQSFHTFAAGVRDALRQDPDVLLVGELRDLATMRAAIEAAETGHLVLATLHTYDAASTLSRLVGSFPPDEQELIRSSLAVVLRGIVSQTLLPMASTKGRVAAYEVLVATTAIQTNLRKTEGHSQLKQTMQTSQKDGMQTMEMALAALVRRGLVREDEAEYRARDVDEFRRQVHFLGNGG